MTVIELIKKLQSLPEDARVEVNIPLKINSAESVVSRQIDTVHHDQQTNVCQLSSYWRIQFFY
jgi:hypothetical protein